MRGIGAATFGAIMLIIMLSATYNAPACFIIGSLAFGFGLNEIVSSTQSLELTPTTIIYQTAFRIARVEWAEIGSYVLDGDRFMALSRQSREILLDIGLTADDQAGWPSAERARAVEWIERKMQEVGAARKSTP